jgi:crotonobetainyl-CoA:carnitine CoA-transferase CaiB-like acyl-CoA transferase
VSWASDGALATAAGRQIEHDRIDVELAAWSAERQADEVVEELVNAGVPAAVVIPGREVVHNPQLRHRRLFEVEAHPITGEHEIPGLPFRFSRVDRWGQRPSPTLGEHNDEVLSELASPEELQRLRDAGVIGDRVKT